MKRPVVLSVAGVAAEVAAGLDAPRAMPPAEPGDAEAA